jgi:hypothetical protein
MHGDEFQLLMELYTKVAYRDATINNLLRLSQLTIRIVQLQLQTQLIALTQYSSIIHRDQVSTYRVNSLADQ